MATCSVTFLGTSDGLPSAERKHASILVDLGVRVYLFDCGEPVSRTLKRSGVSYDAIDRLFISHLHADHCGGFLMLMNGGKNGPIALANGLVDWNFQSDTFMNN
jgi:ribonuclease Z